MPITRATALAMSDDAADESTQPRASRFKEHTNTNGSIRPPPDELWKDIGIEELIEQFNEENAKPPTSRKSSANRMPRLVKSASSRAASGSGTPTESSFSTSVQASATAPTETTYARLQRAFASMFGSVLGKRKAGNADAEREKDQHQQLLDQRKRDAEIAYHEAKDLGLLPQPKVFVRPAMRSRQFGTPSQPVAAEKMQLGLTAAMAEAATPIRTPRTPTLRHTPSKKDLHKQKKLTKRVSDLEYKLASAKKELQTVLYNDIPPVPRIPGFAPPTPDVTPSENEDPSRNTTPVEVEPPASIGKIVKKRKATIHDSDGEYKPIPTDSEGDIDMLSAASASEAEVSERTERSIKRVKSTASKKSPGRRSSSRLTKRFSRSNLKSEEPVRVVPDGRDVPDVPSIPREMESKGKKVKVGDDGFGGLGHEIF
ncbi:uncharacterized protein J4E78_006994 [Alternaria triticimaculans]|uniref:uncharacterized protein n=1 Tax=Alternaria triticimaculans TaxID=297637 RepID=UPI0020C54991|nr:uncharacterized protein J4E78_006994 [Alternaria triticimaculans]KAI4654817.1 hypothetical protein J4E78_006994 [Alternaria triticimaculans]